MHQVADDSRMTTHLPEKDDDKAVIRRGFSTPGSPGRACGTPGLPVTLA